MQINFSYYFVINNKKTAVKTALVEIQIIYLCQDGPHTVRNKGDLDSGIQTKILNLAL